MAEKVCVAMIGAGSMANRVHYPSLASFDDVQLGAICDIDSARLNRTADRFGIEKRYTDYRKMVEEIAPGICVEAELESGGTLYADGETQGVAYDTQAVAGSNQMHIYGGFLAKNRGFMDALKAGSLPGSHFGDALKTMEIAHKILAQATLGTNA